jgi:hypothetical protein
MDVAFLHSMVTMCDTGFAPIWDFPMKTALRIFGASGNGQAFWRLSHCADRVYFAISSDRDKVRSLVPYGEFIEIYAAAHCMSAKREMSRIVQTRWAGK